MNSKPKVGIISSVPANPFAALDFDALGFSGDEKKAALTEEIALFLNTTDPKYLSYLQQSGIDFHIIRAMEGMPKPGEYDALMLGGSPAMVGDASEKPWIANYLSFIHKEVNNGTPVLGMCFGHQVLVTAFGGKVEDMQDGRILGSRGVELNELGKQDSLFRQVEQNSLQTLFSHKQAVQDPGEAQVLGGSAHDPFGVVKIGSDARGAQFHPEFTRDTVTFLAKLMNGQLIKEGTSAEEIINAMQGFKDNQGAQIIPLFLKQYRNK